MKKINNPFENVEEKAKELVLQMTLEEKASLCSGLDFWHTKPIERLGIPSVMVTDGPHGLRKQNEASDHLGINNSVPAACFPTASATACSFDRELMERMGKAIGEECRAENVAVILGPAANIKRSPLCGRNFEYISEDPYLTGETAAALINGIQSQNIGTSMKHYLLNNQEKARLVSNSVVDERAMREIYLTGYERAVKQAQPWTLMCAYNKINGTYACENKYTLTDILRGEWDFKGAVMTDWGAMDDRVEAVQAGLDLEMPGSNGSNDRLIVEAVKEGRLEEKLVDLCAQRMTAIALLAAENEPKSYDKEEHNRLAGEIARESAVLLKKGNALPASKQAKVAVIGQFAKFPRYQGAGSSKINPYKITSAFDAFEKKGISFVYEEGYCLEDGHTDSERIAKAKAAAEAADVVFAFIGLPDAYESEGFDRSSLSLPQGHNELMEALLEVNQNTVAILSAGGVVEMPWRKKADSILVMYLAGQNSGEAVCELLFGDASPCGKLAETWPLALEDTPAYDNFGKAGNVEYRESIYVGYRYYDKAEKEVAYPFGFGLTYTQFEYSRLTPDKTKVDENETVNVTLEVKNTGKMAAKEIVELYVSPPESTLFMPVRELKGYEKVFLEPGESKKVSFMLDSRAFSYYHTELKQWAVQDGIYRIEAGASSRDIRLTAEVELASREKIAVPDMKEQATAYFRLTGNEFPKEQFEAVYGNKLPAPRAVRPYSINSTLTEIQSCQTGCGLYRQIHNGMTANLGEGEMLKMLETMLEDMPLRGIAMLSGGAFSVEQIQGMVDMMNREDQSDMQ